MAPTHVSIEPLKEDNYNTWVVKTQAFLCRVDLLDYADGTTPRPDTLSGTLAQLTDWDKYDKKARSEIILKGRFSWIFLKKSIFFYIK